MLVGRRREFAALASLLDARSAGSALIQGEAGIGKTRLVQELCSRAQNDGFRVLYAVCYQVEETGAYAPILQLVGEPIPMDDDDEAAAAGAGTIGGSFSMGTGPGDARLRRTSFVRHLADAVLKVTSAGPTILCVEDLQWADAGSLLVLNNLLDRETAGLVIITTVRAGEAVRVESRPLVARIEQKSSRLELRGLSLPEVRELVRNLSGPGVLTEGELSHLQAFTNGNPMFVRELLFHLRETDLIERHTLMEAVGRSRTPDRLTETIDLRLTALPKSVHRTLSAASILGTGFSAELVAHALGKTEDAIEDAIEGAVRAGILRKADMLESSRYRFAHPLYAMRLYEALAPAHRRRLHRRLAEAAQGGVVLISNSESARHHALGYGPSNGQRAVRECQAAAEEAESVLAYETAARFWELALSCTKERSLRTRAELYRRLAWASWAAGKWTRAAEAWEECVALFEHLNDWKSVADVALALGEMYRWRQELEKSETWLRRALELLPADSAERRRTMALLASILYLQDPQEAVQMIEEAVDEADGGGFDPVTAFWASSVFASVGNDARAYEVTKLGLEKAMQRRARHTAALLAGNLVMAELARLRLPEARQYARVVEDGAEQAEPPAYIRALLCRALLAGYVGHWTRVASLCERWMASVRLAGPYQAATARIIWAEARSALGDLTSASNAMRQALPDLEHARPTAALHLARVLLQQGEEAEATEIVQQYATGVIDSPVYLTARIVLADVASSLPDPDLWERCYASLEGERRPMSMYYSPLSIERVVARLEGKLRHWPKSFRRFDAALVRLADGGASWELAKTYLDYAEARGARRRRGDARKATSLEMKGGVILEELGLPSPNPRRRPFARIDGGKAGLTDRELEVLALVAEGRRSGEVAGELTLSPRTIERHLENIYMKMGVKTRTEAVVLAVEEGLVPVQASPVASS